MMINTKFTENIFCKVIHLRQMTCPTHGRDHEYDAFREQIFDVHRSVSTRLCPDQSTRIV